MATPAPVVEAREPSAPLREEPDALPAATLAAAPPLVESPSQRRQRLALAPMQEGFEVTVLGMALEPGASKDPLGRREEGIQLKLSGLIKNHTGKTLSRGQLLGALLLRFPEAKHQIRLGPDGLKPGVSPQQPWRDGTARIFEVSTEVYPFLMQEYVPLATEARLLALFQDPVGFGFEAPVWVGELDWGVTRGAPARGQARAIKAEALRAGPRGHALVSMQIGEDVELLYQKGAWFRVRGALGEGWVPQSSLSLRSLETLYQGASPQPPQRRIEDELVAVEVQGVRHLADPGYKLKDGERLMVVDVALENKGEGDIKCGAFFVDYGPREQVGPHKASAALEGALACHKGKLAPGASASGSLAFLRTRHQVPFVIGYSSPSKNYLLLPLYSQELAQPWTR